VLAVIIQVITVLHLKIKRHIKLATFIASRVLTSHHEIGASQMGEPRGADTAPIWPIGPIAIGENKLGVA
jgi:hypothetical protein